MNERGMVRGKDSLICYLDSGFMPVGKEEATMARVLYADGGYELFIFKSQEAKIIAPGDPPKRNPDAEH